MRSWCREALLHAPLRSICNNRGEKKFASFITRESVHHRVKINSLARISEEPVTARDDATRRTPRGSKTLAKIDVSMNYSRAATEIGGGMPMNLPIHVTDTSIAIYSRSRDQNSTEDLETVCVTFPGMCFMWGLQRYSPHTSSPLRDEFLRPREMFFHRGHETEQNAEASASWERGSVAHGVFFL